MITTPVSLTSGGVGAQSSATTASISPNSNQLILIAVLNKGPNNTAANLPTISGLSLTWTEITSHPSSFASGEWRLSMWAAIPTSPVSGTITIDCAGQSQQSMLWGVIQFPSYVKLNYANPQNAFIQTNFAESANNNTITSLTVTLGAFASVNNGTIAVFADDGQANFTGATGQTTIININPSAGNFLLVFNATNQTSITANFSGNNSTGNLALAAEVAFQPSAGIIGDI